VVRYRAAVASAGNGPVSGVVGEDIVVLPDMNSRHVDTIMQARGVVAEVGGPLAHLAIVSRELGCVLMVMPDAGVVLRPGMRVLLNPKGCEILIVD
jgi:phosphohistidine swiveling domain-containing protein